MFAGILAGVLLATLSQSFPDSTSLLLRGDTGGTVSEGPGVGSATEGKTVDTAFYQRQKLQNLRTEWRQMQALDSIMWAKMTAAKRWDRSDSELVRERGERNRHLLKIFCTDPVKIADAADVDSLKEMKSDEKSLCKAELDSSKTTTVAGEE
jgi:hypothetical protein